MKKIAIGIIGIRGIGGKTHAARIAEQQCGLKLYAAADIDTAALEAELAVVATIRFARGAIAEFLCNWGMAARPGGEAMALYGREGHIESTGPGWQPAFQLCTAGSGPTELAVAQNEYETMYAHFADCIRTGQTPLTSAREARRSLELVLAIYRSIETRRPAKLTSTEGA